MKKILVAALMTALLILLCACVQTTPPPNDSVTPPVSETPQTIPTPDASSIDGGCAETPAPVYPEELSMELVVEWDDADALLSRLGELAELLRNALNEVGCPVDHVTITISTAGGFTAEALAQGGIDAAILPAVDFMSCSASTAGIAMSREEISETVIALSLAKEQPSSEFCTALYDALTTTGSGQEFLTLCRPGAEFAVPTEEALQAVADYIAELSEQEGGHRE